MGSLRAASILFALALCAALGLSACGGSSADLLPGKTADQINSNLDKVRSLVQEEDCVGAENAVGEVSAEVDDLSGVDKKLKAALRQGTAKLGEVVSACGEEALAEAEKEAGEQAAEREAEQEREEAVEPEDEELTKEREKTEKAEQKAKEKSEKEAEKETPEDEAETGGPTVPSEEEEKEGSEVKPPVETPGGTEPPAGGIGPGAQVK